MTSITLAVAPASKGIREYFRLVTMDVKEIALPTSDDCSGLNMLDLISPTANGSAAMKQYHKPLYGNGLQSKDHVKSTESIKLF